MSITIKPATTNAIFDTTFTPYNLEQEKDFFKEVYDENRLTYTDYGIDKILDLHYERKTPILNLLSRHPKWDASINAIRLDAKMNLKIDFNKVNDFWFWVNEFLENLFKDSEVIMPRQYTSEPYNFKELVNQYRKWNLDVVDGIEEEDPFIEYYYQSIMDWYRKNTECFEYCSYKHGWNKTRYVSAKDQIRFKKWYTTFKALSRRCEQFTSEETVELVNTFMPELNPIVGQKFSKLVQRFCKVIGINKVKSYKEVTHNGVTTLRDYGYNYKIALVGDALNPVKVPKPTFISAYSIDYLNMSNGHNWNSCHRLSDWEGEDRGCNCSGTLSYMNDDCSFIFYTLPQTGNEHIGWNSESEIENPFLKKKLERCVFQYKDGKLVQGRVYPQSNDSDNGLREEVRAIVQKVIAECLGENNLWTVKKGADEICKYIKSTGTHYRDYTYNYDGRKTSTISFLKSICGSKTEDELQNEKPNFIIGSYPICADCGSGHMRQNSPNCDDCDSDYEYYCDNCGHGFNEESYNATYTDGGSYCCSECAENDGWRLCSVYSSYFGSWDNEEWMRQDDDYIFNDDYTGDWFYDPEYGQGIHTEDYNHYMYESHAESDGYVRTEDGWYLKNECINLNTSYGMEWFHESSNEVYKCPECGQIVHYDYWNEDEDMCYECVEWNTNIDGEEVMDNHTLVSVA